MPTSRPSFRARSFAVFTASVALTLKTSSMSEVSQLPGMNPAPMPWILWGPGLPPLRTGDSSGSTAMVFISGFLDLRNCEDPVRVPPVPTPLTRKSMVPLVWCQISGPTHLYGMVKLTAR